MTKFVEVTEQHYYDMLGVLPPIYAPIGFMVSEATDHCPNTGRPRYTAFVEHANKFYESADPMTLKDFKALDMEAFLTLIAPKDID
jgi:hypothetical protein